MKHIEGYPYNDHQKYLHLSEAYVLNMMRAEAKQEASTPEEEEAIYQKKLAFIEEIKNQDPHPAKVFAKNPACFWDTDVYWLHWQKNKQTIIERVLRCFGHGDVSNAEQVKLDVALLEQFYTEKEILDAVGHSPDPFLKEYVRKDIFNHYGKPTTAFKWAHPDIGERGQYE